VYRKGQEHAVMPASDIHRAIIDVLTAFAKGTRYYNLDYLGGAKSSGHADPIAEWYNRVAGAITLKHYTERQQRRDRTKAQTMQALIGDKAYVLFSDERGNPIEDFGAAMYHSAQTKVIQKYGQLYALQLIRFGAYLIWGIEGAAHSAGIDEVPCLHEFFRVFYNEDRYFLRRKTWSIYRL